jgi:hypothetical protein
MWLWVTSLLSRPLFILKLQEQVFQDPTAGKFCTTLLGSPSAPPRPNTTGTEISSNVFTENAFSSKLGRSVREKCI